MGGLLSNSRLFIAIIRLLNGQARLLNVQAIDYGIAFNYGIAFI